VLDALAARPHLADAAFLYSPVSSSAVDTFRRWVLPDPALRALVEASYGTPATRPRLWRQAGARSYLGRVDIPVLVAHGTADGTCPVRWSRATVAALRQGGADARLQTYPGEDHRFGAAWPVMMHSAVTFLRTQLR
jgi:dipeptidyl aminopeptidase/acylaminoacyl peptidase